MREANCSLCHLPLKDEEPLTSCPACGATSHEECWTENGGCGVYGCTEAPATEKQVMPETPTWWGQEHKLCPRCGREIKAAALRCRFCQTTFDTAAPMTAGAYHESLASVEDQKAVKSWARGIFITGLIPFLAPVVLVGGTIYWFTNGKAIKKLPPLDRILGQLGLVLSAAWILLGACVWALSTTGAP